MKNKKINKKIGGPWTRSMKGVHGPGQKRGSMDQGSMFCPLPFLGDGTFPLHLCLCESSHLKMRGESFRNRKISVFGRLGSALTANKRS